MTKDALSRLADLMAHLRGPDGCPWDRAQTYESLKSLMLEEVYEVVEAVEERDFEALREELGDLLFQVVFYSRLAEEEGRFTLADVAESLHAKLVRRHPHVFGENRARTPEEALESWQAAKAREKQPANDHDATAAVHSLLNGIPRSFPSALEAYELGVRVARVGFDWPNLESLLDKISEEIAELRAELGRSERNSEKLEEETGDLLFASANLARYLNFNPEICLRRANRKFKRRFQAMEQQAHDQGKKLSDCSAEELDALWEAAKKAE
ncbi:MAG TPA: nucleoside triphosphate pyrophosphohydrolase [Terriglobia bacterium]|nr:nucleoside triphosphate pyrophosphohydrolase [Terriglobia bacterium]